MSINHKFQEKWDKFSLHTWLILSSFGIIFAILSFIEELGGLNDVKTKCPWMKGTLAILIGIVFYIFIGLRHIEGAKKL